MLVQIDRGVVEGNNGLYEFFVSPDGMVECTCRGFRSGGLCRHARFLAEFIHGTREAKQIAVSAMHKEIRRGDADRALHWANWLEDARRVVRQKLRSQDSL